MNAFSPIVADTRLSKAAIDELWNPERSRPLEVPPAGCLHTVDTVNQIGAAHFEGWSERTVSLTLMQPIYKIEGQAPDFPGGRMEQSAQATYQSKLKAILRTAEAAGRSLPTRDIFAEPFFAFALGAQDDLAQVQRHAHKLLADVCATLQALCELGKVKAYARLRGQPPQELDKDAWNAPSIVTRIVNCGLNVSKPHSIDAEPDASLFFWAEDVQAAGPIEGTALLSLAAWRQRLGFEINAEVAAMLDAAELVAKAVPAGEHLGGEDYMYLLRGALLKYGLEKLVHPTSAQGHRLKPEYKPMLSKNHLKPMLWLLRHPSVREGRASGLKAYKCDIEALRRRVMGVTQKP